MDAVGDPVIWAKLRPPSLESGVIERPRLTAAFADPDTRVVVMTAPAGYGKSTLMAQLARLQSGRLAWMTADPVDNQPGRFWRHVAASLSAAGVGVDGVSVALVERRLDDAVDQLLASLEVDSEPLTLVIDDLHLVLESTLLAQIDRFVAQLASTVTIGLLSRSQLELSVVRLASQGAAVVLDESDLAFTLDEARAVMSSEPHLTAADSAAIDTVAARLEGWPAGLRLALLAARPGLGLADVGAGIGGHGTEIARYLTDEVLASQSAEVRDFLVATSILDDLTAGACDAVTGTAGGLRTLRSLAADHVFTSLVDPTDSTFRYHGLLREHLLSLLDERPERERNDLHLRAAMWYQRSGDLDAAVRHAVAGGNVDMATQIMVDNYIDAASSGRIEMVWRWVKAVGTEAVMRHPELAPMPAWASLNQHRYDEIEPWLQAIVLVDGLSDAHRNGFELHAESVRSHLARHEGRLTDAVRHGANAVELAQQYPGNLVESTALCAYGVALALVDDDGSADQLLNAIAEGQRSGEVSSIVTSYAYLGLVENDLDDAEAHADAALSMVSGDEMERFHLPAVAWLVRSLAALHHGRVGDAEEAAEAALRIATGAVEPAVVALVEAQRARIFHLLGRDPERRSSLRAADVAVGQLAGGDWIAEQVRSAHAETRFAPVDDPRAIGARELTERELAVLRLLPHGLARRELAQQLFVSENTIKTHLTSIRRKLAVRGRADVVERARALGLLPD